MGILIAAQQLCEYLAGERDTPPEGFTFRPAPLLWGIWWAILLLVILVFSGQTSKFIYIDF